MKLFILGFIVVVTAFHGKGFAYITGSLQSQCDSVHGTMLYDRLIKSFNTSIMRQPGHISVNNINIKIDDEWYSATAEDRMDSNLSINLPHFAQTAYLINLTVNVCVKDKHLRGLEGVN